VLAYVERDSSGLRIKINFIKELKLKKIEPS